MAFKADLSKPTPYDELLTNAEQSQGLPSGLLKLVMMIENRNNPMNRVSPKGASGIMQIMPSNFESLGITDPNDPEQSINGAAKLMAQLNKQYDGDVGAMLAHYNGGNRAGRQYQEGSKMNPETTKYLEYAAPYLEMQNPSKYGRGILDANDSQISALTPSDVAPEQPDYTDDLYTGLDARLEQQLMQEAEIADWSFTDAVKHGFSSTLTEALYHAGTREVDDTWSLGAQQSEVIKQEFPAGLDEGQAQRMYNSRSQADFDYNLGKLTDERDLMTRVAQQDGLGKAAATAAIIGGGLLDPVALPLSTFGAVGKVVKGAGAAASVARYAGEAAIVTGAISPVIQLADKGTVSGSEVFMHMGTAAVMGAGVGTLANLGKVGDAFRAATDEATLGRVNGDPAYSPIMTDAPASRPVNFETATNTSVGSADEIVGIGATEVTRAANAWSEDVSPSMQTVQARRSAWYNNEKRANLMGWADSEGVRLARSKSKVARFVQAMWSGNAAGLGKQEARTAAVLKEQQLESMQFKYIPDLKAHFEASLDAAGKVDYMAGGAAKQQAEFSRAVQLERYQRRLHRAENNGSSEGYSSDAPGPVKGAADVLDNLYGEVKELHVANKTEHYEQLRDSDHVGYIEQRPDYNMLNRADAPKRKAFLDMVKDDYRAEATAKLARMREGKEEWIEQAFQRAEINVEQPWVTDFLTDPSAYFDKHLSNLSKKIHSEMEKRASHWFENALRDPEARYQNSEASLLTLAKEMAEEWFTGREVDADVVKGFQEALTGKWADTSRRELNMLNSRNVNGEELYLLDMFQHDVFGTANNAMADTAGRTAMAKLGWRKEQDIVDTLDAMRHDGATPEELDAAKHISDLILNRAAGLDNSPLVQATSNMVHSTMMGKLPVSLIADMPTIIGNLGIGGMVEALGRTAKYALDGSLFVKDGRPTKLGNDLDSYLKGLMGHDHLLWLPQQLNADGMAMEVGGSVLRRSAAASRFTNTIAGTNWVNRSIGSSMTRTTTKRLHKYLQTGRGINEVRLEDVGIDAKMLKRIKENFDKHSGKDDFGLDKWDSLAREEFVSAAHKFQNQNRVDKGYAGEVPKWTRDNLLGYLFSKFRVIGIRAQEKVLVRNMSIMDSNAVGMLSAGIAFSTFLALGRIHLDAATSKDGRKVLDERLTPAGITDTALKLSTVTGLAAEGMSVYNLLTGNGVYGTSDTPLTGIISSATRAATATGKAVTGEGTLEQAIDANFKLLPGANAYLMMGIKNAE